MYEYDTIIYRLHICLWIWFSITFTTLVYDEDTAVGLLGLIYYVIVEERK